MIEWITNWAEAIIIAVVIATIIEMILPEGNCKKYIKVVIGVYILFTIISPVVTKFTGKTLAISDLIDLNQYIDEVKEKEKTQNLLAENNETSIRDIYIGNLKTDIQNKLKGKGYVISSIELDVWYDENYTLNKIYLTVTKKDSKDDEEEEESEENEVNIVNTVNEVNISVSDSNTTSNVESPNSKESTNTNLTNSDKKKIKEYLSSVYEINEKNIVFN